MTAKTSKLPEPATYEKPAHGWTCFHCGETFKTVGVAQDHFGAKIDAVPGCMIRVQLGSERGLLMALRRVEEELAVLYRERADDDTPLHRELARQQSRHADALQTAEEAGYARGLGDGTRQHELAVRAEIRAAIEALPLPQGVSSYWSNTMKQYESAYSDEQLMALRTAASRLAGGEVEDPIQDRIAIRAALAGGEG